VNRTLEACSVLELAGRDRRDVEYISIRPVVGRSRHVIATIKTGGTCRRFIETTASRMMDGRTCREILDAWLGIEAVPRRSNMLDALPTVDDLSSRDAKIVARLPHRRGLAMESMLAIGVTTLWPETEHFSLPHPPVSWGEVRMAENEGVSVYEMDLVVDPAGEPYQGLITSTVDDDEPGPPWTFAVEQSGVRFYVRDAEEEVAPA